MHSVAYRTGPNHWLPPDGPVQQTRLSIWQLQNYVLALELCVFCSHWSIVVQSKGIDWTIFIHFTVCSYAFSAVICVLDSYLVWALIVVLEILICIVVTQCQLLFVTQDTYLFWVLGIYCSLDCQWKLALQVEMKTTQNVPFHFLQLVHFQLPTLTINDSSIWWGT